MKKSIQQSLNKLKKMGIKPIMTSDELMNLTRDTPFPEGPKPSVATLMQEIGDWELQTKKEIDLHDRKEVARKIASKLL